VNETALQRRIDRIRKYETSINRNHVSLDAIDGLLPIDILDWAMPRKDRIAYLWRRLAQAEFAADRKLQEELSKELETQLCYLYIETHGHKAFTHQAPRSIQ